MQSDFGSSLPQRQTNLRWSRVAPDSFDLKLENPQELNAERIADLLDRLDHEIYRKRRLRKAAREELRLWLNNPREPLKSLAYALVSNWFLTASPGDRNSTIARHCQELWDELFAYRPERPNRLTPTESNRNHIIIPDRFEHFYERLIAAQDAPEVGKRNDGEAMEPDDTDVDDGRYRPLVAATFLDSGFFRRLEQLLIDHKQVILEGPPGSGKTFVARNFAEWWSKPQESGAEAGSEWKVVQFHESYGYEDFFQGIRPQLLAPDGKVIASSDTATPVGQMVYRNSNGIFHQFCEIAARAEGARFVLVIDEINRGKASRIFGELLYLLEYRQERIQLASGEMFEVPKNVYLIGTMNTADRSIALVDYALRRRFKFVGLRPYENGDAPVLRSWLKAKSISDVDRIVKLFCKLNEHISKVNPHFIVGHSYFMAPRLHGRTQDVAPEAFPEDLVEEIWESSILPLLSEYEPHRPLDQLTKNYGLEALLGSV